MSMSTCPKLEPNTFDLVRSPLAGINLIDASAGTGKTYTICGLVLRLLLEKGLTLEQILVVTYTEAATEDLRDRIRQQLRHALDTFNKASEDEFLQKYLATIADHQKAAHLLSDALRSFDNAAIFTIHGFCQRMLLENSFESNLPFDSELVADDSYLIKEIIEDFWRRVFSQSSALFSQYVVASFSPDSLHDFLIPLLPHPFIQLIPDIAIDEGCGHLSDTETEYIEAYLSVCREWTASRTEVCNDLRHSPRLKRTTYNTGSVADLIAAMDGMAAACNPSPHVFEKFNLLASGRIRTGTKAKETAHILPFYERCENLVQNGDKLLTLYDKCMLALKKSLLDSLEHELNIRKTRDNVYSFDDLLRRLHKAVSGSTGSFLAKTIALKYPAALIDEFQDTDPLQYEIFKAIYNDDSLLFLIGDPKQAIYSFRGADIHTYMDAATFSPHAHHTLGVNYRSTPALVQAVNTLFCRVQKPFVYDAISFQPVTGVQKQGQEFLTIDGQQEEPFFIWYLERSKAVGDASYSQGQKAKISKNDARSLIITCVTAEVVRLLQLASENRLCINDKKLAPGDIAVLVRTNHEARMVQQALAGLQVPSVLHSGEDLFASEEAKDMRLLLEAIAKPNSIRRLKTALLTHFMGLQANTVNLLQADSPDNEKTIELWLTRFRTYHELWNRFGFIRMFWTVMQENKVRQRMLSSENGERVLTNILHLAEIIHQEEFNKGLNMAAILGYLQNRLADDGSKNSEHQLRLESDEERVKIVTIHKAKGLEYPVVFCPFTWEGTRLTAKKECLFHQPANDGKTELIYDAGSPDLKIHLQQARQEEMAENLRLLYVALTRAVHRCYLFWGPINGAETSAPAYLLHQNFPAAENPGDAGTGINELMKKVADRFPGLSDHEILTDLQNLASAADGSIRITTGEKLPGNYLSDSKDLAVVLRHRHFTGDIRRDWKISSFSSLIKHRSALSQESDDLLDETPDRDAYPVLVPGPEDVTESADDKYDIFSFPQGAKPGTFLHELLEQADFSSKPPVPEPLICEKLQYFGYETTWAPILIEMLYNLGNVSLHKDIPDLKLSSIPLENCLHELEFYYPLSSLTTNDLKHIFCSMDLKISAGATAKLMDRQLDNLTFAPARGYMRGFIDLVFEFAGKFYLADWKSNHLGSSIGSYHRYILPEPILSNYYFLQYHLYCLALHLYLGKRLPDYEYESHFGGVFYVFLRGVNQDLGPEYGIYHDLPPLSTIEMLGAKLLAE